MTPTALLDLLIVEGIDHLDYPGIIFRGWPGGTACCRRMRLALPVGNDLVVILALPLCKE
jgi:hypothetical protein